MNNAYFSSQDDPRVLTVCMEECWADFDGMMRKMADHLNLNFSQQLTNCVERWNPNRHPYGWGHVRSSVNVTEMNQVKQFIERNDERWFKGWYRESVVASRCGMPVQS